MNKNRILNLLVILITLTVTLTACGSGGGSDPAGGGNNNDNVDNGSESLFYAGELAASIIESTSPEVAMTATAEVLSAGGIGLGDDSPAQYPPASWQEDSRLAFNMAMEARDRHTSGRFTLEELGQMWKDFEFPFAGEGTPGEQLMEFLRISLEDAKINEDAPGSFTPLFIAEMALHQMPPLDISDPESKPEDLRLSLLEIELLIAAFDRAFQLPAGSGIQSIASSAVAEGFCDGMKKFLGTIGTKGYKKSLDHVGGHLSDKALGAMGLKAGEISALKGTMGKVFSALDTAMKVVKLLQIYASAQVTLTIEGDNPIYKPAKGEARVLEPVKATAGVPDETWQQYQKSMGGQEYQNVKSCLDFVGMPLPSDLKDSLENIDKWRVAWEMGPGTEKHTELNTDVNDFNASFSGHPYSMKLVSSGAASATATLKIDIKEEPELATFFQGPYVSKKIKVKAETQTAEPPSPAILAKLTNLVGTLSALLDLTGGWIQTGLPPATTTTFTVKYHPMPDSIDINAAIDMRYVYTHFSDEPAEFEHTARGVLSALLDYTGGTDPEAHDGYGGYRGTGQMDYLSASTKKYPEDGDDCIYSYAVKTFDGQATGLVVPPSNQQGGALAGDPPFQFAIGVNQDVFNSGPREEETETKKCPNSDAEVTTFPVVGKIMFGALNAMNLVDDKILLEGVTSKLPGLSLNDSWILQPNGTLQRTLSGAQRITVLLQDGPTAYTDILSQNTVLKLKPVFATPAE